jgi:hypothetical protein
MLNAPTLDKLHVLHLEGMAATWMEQQTHPNIISLAFDERLGLLVEVTASSRAGQPKRRRRSRTGIT